MKTPLSIFSVFLLMFSCSPSFGQKGRDDSLRNDQKDVIDWLLHVTHWDKAKDNRKNNKIHFSLLPISSEPSSGKQLLVTSLSAAFYLGSPQKTNLSNIYFTPYTNFTNRTGFLIAPSLWTNGNKWNLTGDWRISKNIQDTYGLGGNTTSREPDQINYNYVRVYLNANHLIAGSFYLGLGYNLDYYYHVSDQWNHPYPGYFQQYGIGTSATTTSQGLSFNIIWDSRANAINAEQGFYSTLVYRINPLNNDYHWTSLYFDNRKYFPLSHSRHEVLALRAFYWGTYGNVPYLDLTGTALDPSYRSGRGYLTGRYIGKQELYAESEYRFDISRNGLWGAVVFSNFQSYTEPSSGRFEYILPAAGAGLRLKFNKRSDSNLTFDLAVGRHSFNWYINLGEVF